MISDASFPGDQPLPSSPQPPEQPRPERVTRRDLAEGPAEKVVTERTEAVQLFKGGGVDYANLRDLVEAAKLLAASGPYLPPFMQGNVGACFANCMRAQELGVSPLALAKWTYVVEQLQGGQKVMQIAYESQMFHAVIEARAPITTRLQVGYEGTGDGRRCRVWATFKGEKEPRYFPPLDADPEQFTLGKLRPKRNERGAVMGSPLWDKRPDLQLFYNMSRDWARMHAPDIIAGMYGRDEMEDAGFAVASDVAKDVSPGLAGRLRGTPSAIGQAAVAAIDAAAEKSRSRSHAGCLRAADGRRSACQLKGRTTEMPDAERTYIDFFDCHLMLGDRGHELIAQYDEGYANLPDEPRYRTMHQEFRQSVAARPWINQCIVAREVGARAFGITTSEILSEDRRPDLVDKRHKIIAFTKVMTGASYSHIGRHFGRDHSAVGYACEKYEAIVRAATDRCDDGK